jgi:nucleotide-binding universal stress UspA family protein
MRILICSDGTSGAIQLAELVSKMEFPSDTNITVLGVREATYDLAKLTASIDQIEKLLSKKHKVDRRIRNGNPIEEIMAEAIASSYDLVVVGGGGGQLGLLHPRLGSTTSKLARKLHTHFLVGRNIPEIIIKILVCAGPDAPSNMTMKLGGKWLSNTSAKIGLLHVIPDLPELPDQKPGKEYQDTLLIHATQQLRETGLKNEILPLIRRGLVVDEVINELADGDYQLLVVGAHYQPGQDRWQGTLWDDVTDQLLNKCHCSVLII